MIPTKTRRLFVKKRGHGHREWHKNRSSIMPGLGEVRKQQANFTSKFATKGQHPRVFHHQTNSGNGKQRNQSVAQGEQKKDGRHHTTPSILAVS